jgi:competence protein ComEC
MTIERELVRIAMSFTAGIAISGISATCSGTTSTAPSTISLTIAAFCVACLLHPRHKELNNSLLWIIITTIFLCLGFFVSATGRLVTLSVVGETSFMSGYALRFGERMSDLTGELPFADRDTNSLITALITGDRSGLSQETRSAFRESGASHILALSGLHLGIIYGIMRWATSLLGNGKTQRILRSAIIISLCGFYTLATGASASITRAFLFIILGETASLTGRFRSTRSILWTALILQLFFIPESAGDIGFQLSYAAMAGIAYIYPFLKNLWPETDEGAVRKGLKWIWNSASMSIACQITTGPLAWIYFGTFPKYFLLTNLISLPLVGLIIPFSIAVIGLSACGICPDFLVRVLESMTDVLEFCLKTIADL